MLTAYPAAAMHAATYEWLDEDRLFYGSIPGLDGVFAVAETLELCRDQLAEVLEERVVLGLAMHHQLPPIGGIEITVPQVV